MPPRKFSISAAARAQEGWRVTRATRTPKPAVQPDDLGTERPLHACNGAITSSSSEDELEMCSWLGHVCDNLPEVKPEENKVEQDTAVRKSAGAALMQSIFNIGTQETDTNTDEDDSPVGPEDGSKTDLQIVETLDEIFLRYLSDETDQGEDEECEELDETPPLIVTAPLPGPALHPVPLSSHIPSLDIPPPKHRRLEVPARQANALAQKEKANECVSTLSTIESLLRSLWKEVFVSGPAGLQAYRARTIQSCLHMMVHNGRRLVDASQQAAEAQGFAPMWGRRLVRGWTQDWIWVRELPQSMRGRHAKTASLLDDPDVRAKLRSFVRSNKWSMTPDKLMSFLNNEMLPVAVKDYAQNLVRNEIPQGLKTYLEKVLLPRIHHKTATPADISIHTACRFLHREGFRYTEYKKALYFDGHERLDVVHYRHQTLQYGKNYEGYWNGDLLAKQIFQLREKFIPSFEAKHGPSFQALILMDHSQVFHASLLTAYKETATHGPNYEQLPPDLIDDGEEYDIEDIVHSKPTRNKKGIQYFVK
ncbi:hypothetical protein OF83DRAFT_1173634 [Amylostereum chailletii]|nr:hypothetical protein OF83DRAFT_1173634 [Amylostereum chailletii]